MPRYFLTCRFLLPIALGSALNALAADWPQFLGPNRDGVSAETNLNFDWGADGPPKLWQRPVGHGFSGPTISGGKLLLFHRLGDREIVERLDAASGATVWKHDYATDYRDDFGFDDGPRASPTIAAGKVFVYGAEGGLHCLALADGHALWDVDCKADFGSAKGFFGRACSPLVEEGRVILNVGGTGGNGIVAFNSDTGKTVWRATDDEASYSSPVVATIGVKPYGFVFTRAGLTALDPVTGKVYFQFPWRSPMNASVNAATPLVINDTVFLSASYDTGAILLRVKDGRPAKIWSAEDALSNHYATSVYSDGFFYGFNGRQEMGQTFNCVDAKTGKVVWSQDGLGAGTVIVAGGRLLILTEKGELIAAEASPQAFKTIGRFQALPFQVRAPAALSDGLFCARSKDQLLCLDLRRKKTTPP